VTKVSAAATSYRAVAGPGFGFLSASALMLVNASFAGALYITTADEAQPAFGAIGLHLSWQVYAIVPFVLVMTLAYLDITVSATVILVMEGISMALVIIACGIVLAKGGYHGQAFSPAPFRPDGAALSVLGLGIVLSFSTFSGFEASSTMGEESRQPRRQIPLAIAVSLAVAAIFEIGVAAVVTNAYPGVRQLSAATVPLVTVTDKFVAGWMGTIVNFGAVAAAIIFTFRRRMPPATTVILLVGLAVLGYVAKDTFAPIPATPFDWDALAAGITLLLGIALPFAYPPLRRGIENSPLLIAGTSALLTPRRGNEAGKVPADLVTPSRGMPAHGAQGQYGAGGSTGGSQPNWVIMT
jgi:hypothetical protein